MGINSERMTRLLLAGIGLGCFALLLTLEIVTESDDLEWPDVLVDAVGILLVIGASVGVAMLATRMQGQHEEKLNLTRADLASGMLILNITQMLALEGSERPRLVTLYFSDVDSAGHRYGPEAPETGEAVRRVDGYLERLVSGLETLGQLESTHIVLTSDHGDFLAGFRTSVQDINVADNVVTILPGDLRITQKYCKQNSNKQNP